MIPPIGLKLVNMLTARSRAAPKESATIPVADGMKVAPPIACTARSTISRLMLSTSPQHNDATVNRTMASRNTARRPYWSLSRPAKGSTRTRPSAYTVIVHDAQLICVCRSCCRAGRAVATMVWSIDAISIATETMAKITRRCGLGSTASVAVAAARSWPFSDCLVVERSSATSSRLHCLPASNYCGTRCTTPIVAVKVRDGRW